MSLYFLLDIGFIAYDVGSLIYDEIKTGGANRAENLAALAADVGSAAVPVATGGGVAVRAGIKVEKAAAEANRAGKAAETAADLGQAGSAAIKGGVDPVRQGQAGVEKAKAAAAARGRVVIGEEVTVKTSKGTRRVDLITKEEGGGLKGIEVKTGKSPYTKSQQAKDTAIATEGGVAVGRKAEKAGISGPVKFPTEVEKY